MSLDARNKAIIAYYNTNVETALSIPTEYPNVEFDKPQDSIWARLTFLEPVTTPSELGPNGKNREDGNLVIQLFYPPGRGTGTVGQAADSIATLFKRLSVIADLVFLVPTPIEVGVNEGYYQINVVCPYRYIYT